MWHTCNETARYDVYLMTRKELRDDISKTLVGVLIGLLCHKVPVLMVRTFATDLKQLEVRLVCVEHVSNIGTGCHEFLACFTFYYYAKC